DRRRAAREPVRPARLAQHADRVRRRLRLHRCGLPCLVLGCRLPALHGAAPDRPLERGHRVQVAPADVRAPSWIPGTPSSPPDDIGAGDQATSGPRTGTLVAQTISQQVCTSRRTHHAGPDREQSRGTESASVVSRSGWQRPVPGGSRLPVDAGSADADAGGRAGAGDRRASRRCGRALDPARTRVAPRRAAPPPPGAAGRRAGRGRDRPPPSATTPPPLTPPPPPPPR